jgi:hypothetical protein
VETRSPDNILNGDLLVSWKDIAAYLKCSVRKAQRLERLGLPVKRIPGTKSVWASGSEIDRWLKLQSEKPDETTSDTGRPSSAAQPDVFDSASPSTRREYRHPLLRLARAGFLGVLLAATAAAAFTSAYGLAIVLFAVTLAFVAVNYRGRPESRVGRSLVGLFVIAGMAYGAGATTLPEITGTVINMMTLRPALVYPFVNGLRFIPIPVLISILLVVRAVGHNANVDPSPRLRKGYLFSGVLLLLVAAIAGLSSPGVHRIWQAGLPIRWTLLAGESFILAVNVGLFILGSRCWNAKSGKDCGQLLSWCGAGYLLIALTAAIVVRHWNDIDKYHLDIRRPHAYRVQNPNAEEALRQWLQRHPDEVGPDFLSLSADGEFLSSLRTQLFYKENFDEPFQVRKKAVIFGYRSSHDFRGKRPFVLIRFPAGLAAALRFESADARR